MTAAKFDRKAHVRDVRARLTGETGGDVAESPVLDMDDEALKAWHTGVIQNPRASIKEQQASAIELARLKGYHKREGSGGDGMVNMMDELIAHKARMKS
ncbi:MAG: hypothetical protein JW713_06500 [Pontiellaceae bacterium]|nr:hypothetical protein [Pontiellaceae bacterium]